jgi:hypothetical protein
MGTGLQLPIAPLRSLKIHQSDMPCPKGSPTLWHMCRLRNESASNTICIYTELNTKPVAQPGVKLIYYCQILEYSDICIISQGDKKMPGFLRP